MGVSRPAPSDVSADRRTATERRVTRRLDGEPRFVTRSIGAETIIVPVAARMGDLECVYTLNEIGSRIWEQLDTPRSALEIAKVLAVDYDAPEGELVADVTAFIETLEASGLVRALPEAEG